MADNVYEGMFILDSNRYGRDAAGISARIAEMIQSVGGEMLVSRLWEERRLAYPINAHRKGTYWLTYFRLDGKHLTELERQCRLEQHILRALFLKVDSRLVDTLVAHAQVAATSKAPEGTAGASEGTETEATGEKAVAIAEKPAEEAATEAPSTEEDA